MPDKDSSLSSWGPAPAPPARQYGPWRKPSEETRGLYPGFVVCDGRVSGSITVGPSRLPLWAIGVTPHMEEGWDYARDEYGVSDDDIARFIGHLLDLRGDFARLILLMANGERCEWRGAGMWWERKVHRQRVSKALRRCLSILEGEDAWLNGEREGAPLAKEEKDSTPSSSSGLLGEKGEPR